MQRLAWAATLVLAFIVYWIGLSGPLVFDDFQNLAPVTRWMQGELDWTAVVSGNGSGLFGRSVSMASFVANVAVLGPGVWSLKLGNLLLHLANGCLVYALFRLLLQCKALVRDPLATNPWLALLGAAIWILHPLLASTVLYVIQRMAMLAAFFMFLALLSYLKARIEFEQGNRRKAVALFALVVPCTVLAALSKENGILAPALCAVIELFAFAPPAGRRRPWASRAVVALGLVAPALIAIVLVALQHPAVVGGYADRPFTLGERLLTQSRVLWQYVGALTLPHGPRLGLFHDDFSISHGWFQPPGTAVAMLAWLAAIVIAWKARRSVPALGLGLGVFLVGQALESSIFPLVIYFEHRNYLPAVGMIWALLGCVVYLAMRIQRHMQHAPRIFAMAAVALVLVLAAATASRALVWQSLPSLLAQGLRHHPDSRWVRMSLVKQAMAEGRVDLAKWHADAMLGSADPGTRRLGAVLKTMAFCASSGSMPAPLRREMFSGRPDPIQPDLLVAMESLADGLVAHPCVGLEPATAASLLSAMLDRSALPPGHVGVWRLRLKASKLYFAANDLDAALEQARLAWDSGTADPSAGLYLAALQLRRGDDSAAAATLDQVAPRIQDRAERSLLDRYRAELGKRAPGARNGTSTDSNVQDE